tara:strand:- start:234 stop:956 length:723 start_codon:yes stop_codon:yes gene_type:complete
MEINENRTVAQLVSENIKTSSIFKKHGIDFCCGGGISLKKACDKHKVDFALLKRDLAIVDEIPFSNYDYNNWDLNFLIDHILHRHHSYVEQNLPIILQFADKVAAVHGHHYKEVIKINELVKDVSENLKAHLKKEEMILFPYIKLLLKIEKEEFTKNSVGNIQSPITVLEQEHETVGTIFKTISKLTNSYNPPKGACNTFKALYANLEEFEKDLHLHVHLENNILHPKAIALEKTIVIDC